MGLMEEGGEVQPEELTFSVTQLSWCGVAGQAGAAFQPEPAGLGVRSGLPGEPDLWLADKLADSGWVTRL